MLKSRSNQSNRVNAPELAYKTVYGHLPKNGLRGRIPGIQEKKYGDIYVDFHIDETILDQLNDIRNIEIRSSCEGHGPDRVAFVIFRLSSDKIKDIDKIIENLRKQGLKADYDIGNQGRYRICVATKKWYRENGNNDSWNQWWEKLPHLIENAVNNM